MTTLFLPSWFFTFLPPPPIFGQKCRGTQLNWNVLCFFLLLSVFFLWSWIDNSPHRRPFPSSLRRWDSSTTKNNLRHLYKREKRHRIKPFAFFCLLNQRFNFVKNEEAKCATVCSRPPWKLSTARSHPFPLLHRRFTSLLLLFSWIHSKHSLITNPFPANPEIQPVSLPPKQSVWNHVAWLRKGSRFTSLWWTFFCPSIKMKLPRTRPNK